MGTTTTTRLITVAEFETMPEPEQGGKQELLEGELIQLAPPKFPHQRIVKRLFRLLDRHFDENRVGDSNTGFQMAPFSWLVPDASITWPDQRIERDWLQGAPIIAVEVESPSNTATEFARKVSEYLSHGGLEVWLIYPEERNMIVHTKEGKSYMIADTYTCQCTSPEVTIRLADLFD
jgi:Uma2 family endonuclease